MIKCNVTACGIIVSSAVEKTNKDGGKFLAFTMVVPIEGKDKSVKELHIGVTTEGDQTIAGNFAAGRKVTVKGNLYIKKVEDNMYFNLRAEGGIEQNETSAIDRLEGNMKFKGKISKQGIETKTSKKGTTFKTFSAFSSDKDGEKRAFTWVKFTLNQFLDYTAKAGDYVEVDGQLLLDVYQQKLQLGCRATVVAPWNLNSSNSQDAQ